MCREFFSKEKLMATAPPVVVVDDDDKDNKDNGKTGIAVAIALVMFLLGIGVGYLLWNDSTEKVRLTNELAAATAKIADLEKRPPVNVVQGMTKEQCAAVATDITKQSCVGKTETVTKTVTKYRDRPMAQAPVSTPSTGTRSDSYERFSKPLDRCIFRIKGEIKSETFVQNGEVNCPIWRDKQLSLFNQNPKDKIWDRKYPTSKPM